MHRRTFVGISTTVLSSTVAGCSSTIRDEDNPSADDSEEQPSNNGSGPVGPEDAVEHYDSAIELLDKNRADFEEVRQQLLLEEENIDFSASTIISRTTEARNKLDSAAREDDGSLEDEIETLRRVATYQETLADYNSEYLKLTRLINAGIDSYSESQYQPAIDSLESARQQIDPTRSALEDVDEKLDSVREAAEIAEMSDEFIESLLVAADDNAEIREELEWLEQIIPARLREIRGERAFESGTTAFENERYTAASSQYSDAETYFASAETELTQLDVEEVTRYIESLVDDSDRLSCRYGYMTNASEEMAKASQDIQNDNTIQADVHLENANSYLSKIGTC